MSHRARAWFLYPGTGTDLGKLAALELEEYELRPISCEEVLVEPLFGSFEANIIHALLRKPVDVCKQRNEPRVILGNTGVVRVVEVGSKVAGLEEGRLAILFSASVIDPWGYPELALAYDAPGTMGCLSTKMILRPHELIPIPAGTRHSLPQWAAFSGRYVTAWSNWEQAHGSLRLLLSKEELPSPHVWGWGGGTTLAELDLARRWGCQTVMLSGNDLRLELIGRTGVTPLDRRQFGSLSYDERRFVADLAYRKAYLEAEAKFLAEVARRTGGMSVQIFVDYIGAPVFRPTIKALGRQAVIASAGWKEGMALTYLRASECIARHQHVNTHYARYPQGVAAIAYAEAEGWMPTVDERIWSFEEIPELCRRFHAGELGHFPVFSVNPTSQTRSTQ